MKENIIVINEDDLVEQIKEDIESYFSSLNINGKTKSPSNTQQGFQDFNKYCGDLIASYENFGTLILEVKSLQRLKNKDSLPSYKEDQHKGLIALGNANIPIYFSYNICPSADFKDKSYFEENLKNIIAPLPSELIIGKSKQIISTTDTCLLDIIQKIGKTGNWINACAALELFFNPKSSQINSGINLLNTKILILIYDQNFNKVLVLNRENAMQLINEIIKIDFISATKGSEKFMENITKIKNIIIQEIDKINPDKNTLTRVNGPGSSIF